MNNNHEQNKENYRTRKSDGKKKLILIILAFLIGLGVVGGGVAVYKIGYEKGQSTKEGSIGVNELGEAVKEKTEAINLLDRLNRSVPDEVDEENITSYLELLETTISEIKNEDAHTALETYHDEWTKLKDAYLNKDETAVESSLKTLEASATEAAEKFTNAYNAKIRSAADKLQ